MDQQLLQRTRYLLQTRFRRARTAPFGNFELVCGQVLNWLESHPLLSSILQHLDDVPGDHHQEIQVLLATEDRMTTRYYYLTVRHGEREEAEPEYKGYTPKSIEEHASACLQIIRASIQRADEEFYRLLSVYLTQEDYGPRGGDKNPLDAIKDIALHDLYEYLDEQLDGINAVNGLLRKYKQNLEWFQYERIQEVVEKGYNGEKGERALALHLQQYIFDQGVDFVVEPSSVSGKADLLLRDPSGQHIIIDAKLIANGSTPSTIKRKIAEGFNQVARYCDDYNQPEGFLAVFVNDDINILINVDQNDGFGFFKIAGSVIYYIALNIAARPTASKSGRARQVQISQEELLAEIKEITDTEA